jgi:hypothetical protein
MRIATLIGVLLLAGIAFATGTNDDDSDGTQEQGQEQYQGQDQAQGQEQTVSIENAAAGGQAVNEGNEQKVEFNSNYEGQAPDIVMIPNNNTEKCLRIFGLSFSTTDGGGGIGFPWRSAPCDFEQAADDAFSGGERDLGWFWKCQNKNLYKQFRSKGESNESAMTDCQDRMMKSVSQTQMIARLKDDVRELNLLRQQELEQYRQSRQRCEDLADKLEENCTK